MSTIKLKRSAVPGKIPTTSGLELGELAFNTHDGRMYAKKSAGGADSIVSFVGQSATQNNVHVVAYTGNNSQVAYALPAIPRGDQYISVYLNGVLQHITEYSYSGQTLTFGDAPLTTDEIEIRIYDSLSSNVHLRDYKTFVYTFNSSQTTFSGADDNNQTLAYDPTKISVFANGVKLVDGDDFTASNGTSIVLDQAISSGHVEITSMALASFVDHDVLKPVNTPLTANTANQVVDTFSGARYRTAKYLVQMTQGTNYHATEVLLIHDGTTVYMTEYGTIFSNASLGTVDGDINAGNVRLLVSPASTNTTIKAQRLQVGV